MTEPTSFPDFSLSTVRNLQPLEQAEVELITQAKAVINAVDHDTLTPERLLILQQCLHRMLELSPHPSSTATWIADKLPRDGAGRMYNDIYQACTFAKSSGVGRPSNGNVATSEPASISVGTPRRSTTFSSKVKSTGRCGVSGLVTDDLQSCHIISFSSGGENQKVDAYRDLVKAMFGHEAFEVLLTNVMNGGKDTNRNINRPDNGIPLTPSCHTKWDSMRFYLSVDWSTYNEETKEFEARFHWLKEPGSDVLNCWGAPLHISPSGIRSWPVMEENDRIPFQRITLPQTPDGAPRVSPPIPSAHLLYVRETIVQIAHIMGASGEHGDYDDDDDDDDYRVTDPAYYMDPDPVSSLNSDPRMPLDRDRNHSPTSHQGQMVKRASPVDIWSPEFSLSTMSENALALDLAISPQNSEVHHH
ncbi:hypothetical protein GP486_006367, partial [Trichoglossum hirsutum]